MNHYIIPLLALVFLTSCQQDANPGNEQGVPTTLATDTLTMELNELHKLGHINGFSVAIVNEGKVLYQKGGGYADIYSQEKYTEHTIQNIASITKNLYWDCLTQSAGNGEAAIG
jgi:CubicO group peptidase (beta-lactamase class C family)